MDVRVLVGANTKRLRGLKGWSQEELAHQSGLHRTYISGVERGVRNPTVTVLVELARALDVSPGEFFEAVSSLKRGSAEEGVDHTV